MTRQEKIEELQDRVWHNRISNIDDLRLEISCAEYDGEETIEPIDDILAPLEFNYCDLCGGLYPSDEMCWTAYLEEEYDHDLIKALELRGEDPATICYECVKELNHEAE